MCINDVQVVQVNKDSVLFYLDTSYNDILLGIWCLNNQKASITIWYISHIMYKQYDIYTIY